MHRLSNRSHRSPLLSSSSSGIDAYEYVPSVSKEQKERERMIRMQKKRDKSATEELCHWIEAFTYNNIQTKYWKCEIGTFYLDNNISFRGMKSKTYINKGDIIASVPIDDSFAITAKTVLNDSTVKKFLMCVLPVDLEFTFEHLFYIFLVSHKNKANSRYRQYIQGLPKIFDVPIMWENYQIEILDKVDAQIITEELDRVWEIYCVIKEAAEISSINTLSKLDFHDDFLWAYNVVKTRGFHVDFVETAIEKNKMLKECFPGSDGLAAIEHNLPMFDLNHISTKNMLVPFIDMINHVNSNWNADIGIDINRNWVLTALRNIEPEEQVFINYNPEPTNIVFTTYGFIDDSRPNPAESITFSPNDFSNDPQVQQRLIDVGLFSENEPIRNAKSMCVTSRLGGEDEVPSCSWAMQKAAIIVSVDKSPNELGAKTYFDILENADHLNYQKISNYAKNERKFCKILVKTIKNKIQKLNDTIEDLKKNVFFQHGNDMAAKLCKVQAKYLVDYLDYCEKNDVRLYDLFDPLDLISSNEGSADEAESDGNDSGTGVSLNVTRIRKIIA